MDDLWSKVLDEIMTRARNRIGQLPIDPTKGFDGAPVPPQVSEARNPWSLNVGGNETTLSLPSNKGANFEGYVDYGFNPFSPRVDFKGMGLRYRYNF